MDYCRPRSDAERDICSTDNWRVKREKTRADKTSGHYCAINFQNCETVEVRLWRGSLGLETIRATIEATAALALIAGDDKTDIKAVETWTWTDIKREMFRALKRYDLPSLDLASYLRTRGL